MKYNYLFGPVPSRRLGISLGIDLVPAKTCTLNCVYCECGVTTHLTKKRTEYVPTHAVVKELHHYLTQNPGLDYITLAGSGEPTLHTGIGDIIHYLKLHFPSYRVAVLTNGTLLYLKTVRHALREADVIIPSLDAVSAQVFHQVNRPVTGLVPSRIIDGLVLLRQEYHGQIWLEIFIVPGVNDRQSELQRLKRIIHRIHPDRIQLNTLDRPGAEAWVLAASLQELHTIASFLGAEAQVQAVVPRKQEPRFFLKEMQAGIIALIKRRPCTLQDIVYALNIKPSQALRYIQALLKGGFITVKHVKRGDFYTKTSRRFT